MALVDQILDTDVARMGRERAINGRGAPEPRVGRQTPEESAPKPTMRYVEDEPADEEDDEPFNGGEAFDPESREQLSPEEQKQYNAIMAMALTLIQGDSEKPESIEASNGLVEAMAALKDDPAQAVAEAGAMVYRYIDEKLPQGIPEELWAVVAEEIGEHLIDIMHHALGVDMTGEVGQQAGHALVLAIADYEGLTPQDMEEVLGYVPEEVGQRVRSEVGGAYGAMSKGA